MSDEPKYLYWVAGTLAGVSALALIGYLMPVEPPRPAPPAEEKGVGGMGFSEEALMKLLQAQQQQQRQKEQKRKPIEQTLPKLPPGAASGPPKPQPQQVLSNSGVVQSVPDFHDISEEDIKEQRMYQRLNNFSILLQSGKKEEARVLAESILEDLEDLYGEGNDRFMSFCLELSKIFGGPSYKHKVFDRFCTRPEKLEEEMQALFSIGLDLIKTYDREGNVERSDDIYSALLEIYRDAIEDDARYKDVFLQIATIRLSTYRSMGRWRELSSLVSDIRNRFIDDPLSLHTIVESQVSSYHQEGKTDKAISYLNSYYAQIKDLSDPHFIIPWCLQRTAKFLFYLNQFDKSLDHLLQLLGLYETQEETIPIEYLSDLLAVYVELGEEGKALEIFQKIKHEGKSQILSRSNYLLTCAVHVKSEYKLDFKVCRIPPSRKEGEVEESEDKFERKLKNFYVEATFENPEEGGEPIIVCQAVDHFDFSLSTPVSGVKGQHWYLVKLTLFKDETKEEILGRHWQPVLSKKL